MSTKKEIHAYIDSDLYLWIRKYALKYIEYGHKNWLGKAIEDAIISLKEKQKNKQF